MLVAAGCALLAACGASAAGAGSARSGAAPPATACGVGIQAVFDAAGNPELVANFSPDGGLAKARWSICSPPDVTRCTPTPHLVALRPGPVPAGTVFEASATYEGRT